MDTGGIRQQFFNDPFECFAFKDSHSMFTGEQYQLPPYYTHSVISGHLENLLTSYENQLFCIFKAYNYHNIKANDLV